MASTWQWVYRHRNPNHPDLRGMWPNEAEARECNGLLLVPMYDPHRGDVMRGWWELRHKNSGQALLFICAEGDELAEEYATPVAERANWAYMREAPEWSAPPHSLALIDYLRSTSGVFYEPNFGSLLKTMTSGEESQDWDQVVPYAGEA
ncbi:hypothetical protein GGR20_003213 [Devosia subaequoris]|uniref:Uncharacterized protein n=1 Tax=Devosia subaequoris TaxID=395930 RepID=A0A7W6IPT5_9HYPH|nr:hypothetical protein [Devosia subaequoris]MBB4053551.1 hypothetical protein [Devosia subaequoris]MCP1211289.1 hypothetical protein [Devosia subaequoris]